MPRIVQLTNPNLGNWSQVNAPQQSTLSASPDQSDNGTQGQPTRSPFMHASMPLAASTSDAYSRQLYGGANVPTYRILAAGKVTI